MGGDLVCVYALYSRIILCVKERKENFIGHAKRPAHAASILPRPSLQKRFTVIPVIPVVPASCITPNSSGLCLTQDSNIDHSTFQDRKGVDTLLERLLLTFMYNPPASLVQTTAIQRSMKNDAVIPFDLNFKQNCYVVLLSLSSQGLGLHPIKTLRSTYLCAGLTGAVGAHELHKLLERVLMMVVAYGGVGEVGAGLLDDRRGGEVQG